MVGYARCMRAVVRRSDWRVYTRGLTPPRYLLPHITEEQYHWFRWQLEHESDAGDERKRRGRVSRRCARLRKAHDLLVEKGVIPRAVEAWYTLTVQMADGSVSVYDSPLDDGHDARLVVAAMRQAVRENDPVRWWRTFLLAARHALAEPTQEVHRESERFLQRFVEFLAEQARCAERETVPDTGVDDAAE